MTKLGQDIHRLPRLILQAFALQKRCVGYSLQGLVIGAGKGLTLKTGRLRHGPELFSGLFDDVPEVFPAPQDAIAHVGSGHPGLINMARQLCRMGLGLGCEGFLVSSESVGQAYQTRPLFRQTLLNRLDLICEA